MTSQNAVSGLASGIDTKAIIDSQIAVARLPTVALEARRTDYTNRLSLTRSLNTKLLTTQIDMSSLLKSSTFASRSATSSSTSTLTATASSTAQVGTHTFTVQSVAAAHQIASRGFSSSSNLIGTGTVTLQVGVGALSTITVDNSNNTLSGFAAAVNALNTGVTAAVINDGTANPYRLTLTSKTTGATNTINFDTSALVGGQSAAFGPVQAGSTNTSSGTVALAGPFTQPVPYILRVVGSGNEITSTFEVSTNDGTSWNPVANPGTGTLDLGNGVTVNIGAGTFDTTDTWSVGAYRQLVTAADSSVQYGSGLSALTVTSTTKQIKDVVPGLTLDLVTASVTPVTITIANDGVPALNAAKKIITDLNDVIDFWKTNGGYDTNTKRYGPLANEGALRNGINAIINSFTGIVAGLPQGLSALTTVGVSIDKTTGKLSLDEAVFNAKMAADPDGVGRLFGTSGSSTSTGIQFVAMGEKTTSNVPFGVSITQAAAQAKITGYGALGVATVINGTNNRLRMAINGTTYDITLASNTYSRANLVTHLQGSIDTLAGANQVVVSLDGSDQLVFTTKAYGSSFSLATSDVGTSDARAALSLAVTSVSGVNVAGTINNAAATGLGQALTANAGSSAEGLRVLVTGAAGISGSVTGRRGAGQSAYNRILEMTKASTGSVPQKEDTYTKLISGLDVQIKRNDVKLATRRSYYEKQFLAMESIISRMKAQGDALTAGMATFLNSVTNSNSNKSS